MIETGRYNKIPKELRLCPLCLKTVETEIHFLVECPVYTNMREKILERILLKKIRLRILYKCPSICIPIIC